MNQLMHNFGKVRNENGSTTTNYRYNQEYYGGESDLIFMRARVYDPFVGRFISRDPISGSLSNPQTQNPYSYAINNPINFSDPSGLWYIDVGLSTGIIGPLGGGGGVQINDQGITPYVSGGAVTPGKGVTLTYSEADPQQNTATVNFAGNFILAGSLSYPYTNSTVPISSGEIAYGLGFPAGASATVNYNFSTYCWK